MRAYGIRRAGDVVAAMFGHKSKTGMSQAKRAAIQGSMDRCDLATVKNILKGGAAGREAPAWATLQNDRKVRPVWCSDRAEILRYDQSEAAAVQCLGRSAPDDGKRFFEGLLKMGEGMLIAGAAFKLIAGHAGTVAVVRGIASGFSAVSKAVLKLDRQ